MSRGRAAALRAADSPGRLSKHCFPVLSQMILFKVWFPDTDLRP
jgi:hypothetical protein